MNFFRRAAPSPKQLERVMKIVVPVFISAVIAIPTASVPAELQPFSLAISAVHERVRWGSMHAARSFLTPVGLMLPVSTGSSSAGVSAENGGPDVEPVLRLEKPRYVLGEAIRFWVGRILKNSTAIPEELRKPCSLDITKPDGTHRVDSVGWSAEGIVGASWSGGGWGLGEETVESGHYTLVLECVGNRTPPVELIVEQSEILHQITADFRFERQGAIRPDTQVPVVLTVQNNSPVTIRFPQRGAMGEGIGLDIIHQDPPSGSSLFFPWEKLSDSNVMPDTYAWDVASQVPSVVLQPGEHFEQRFLLQDAYLFNQAGDYNVTFSTVLSVLVGEKDGQFAEICPIRIPVTASANFVLSSSE